MKIEDRTNIRININEAMTCLQLIEKTLDRLESEEDEG